VIAPEPGPGSNRQASLFVLLRNTLLVSALIFAGLEFWRPYFFLTDDNLDAGFPFLTEVGRHLLSGQSPFYSDHLFGGHYDLLRDASYFCWHPLYLATSLLTATPLHFALMDVNAFMFLMLATAGFVVLADYLRREMPLRIRDGWIMFYALSFTYSMIAITTGSSWLGFLDNHSALPWLTLGILQKTWRRGLVLVVLFSLHQILGGHLLATISNSIFLSFFALGVSVTRRSVLPLGCWLGGYAVAVLILLPVLVPVCSGFLHAPRSGGVPLEDMQTNNIPFGLFPMSIFLGMAIWIIKMPEHPYATYTLALGASAAAWCLLPAMLSRARWRPLELVVLGMMIFGMILICRPVWITWIMFHLPIFKSMRWPFRELVQFQFFFHLFLVLRRPGMTRRARRIAAIGGSAILIIPLLLYILPPTFNSMNRDRNLLLTGGFDRYWAQVRPLLKPTDRIAVLIPLEIYSDDRFEEPYSLLGTYDYAVLADVVNARGYSSTPPTDQLYTWVAFYPFGAFLPSQKADLMADKPDLKFITLESLRPLKITLSSRDGPTIDLTPFVPPELPHK
jgi:hypothetical protein